MNIIKYCENYAVTEDGKVFSLRRFKGLGLCNKVIELTQLETRNGYLTVNLTKDKKEKTFYVHRLIAETFIPNPKNLPQVNHKDGNKKNNHVSNLEWCTRKYNIQHAVANGLKPPPKGEINGNTKITEIDAKNIINLILDGFTNKEIAEKYNLHDRYVSLIRGKKRWKYLWERDFSNIISIPKSNNTRTKNLNAQRLSKTHG